MRKPWKDALMKGLTVKRVTFLWTRLKTEPKTQF